MIISALVTHVNTVSSCSAKSKLSVLNKILDFVPPHDSQGSLKEVVSVSNMGIAKRGPIIESRDHLLLEYTDGSVCVSDGQTLAYTTRIHLVCSRGSQVSLYFISGMCVWW